MAKKGFEDREQGLGRREVLECLLWAGTGVLWTIAGGVPKSSLMGSAQAAEAGFTFLQISDSHVGFDKKANPNALGTLQEAIAKVKALPNKPAFMLHTGDITHLSKPKGIRRCCAGHRQRGPRRALRAGEHDNLDEVPSNPISSATARTPRAQAGIPSTRTVSISSSQQCDGPQGRRHGQSRA